MEANDTNSGNQKESRCFALNFEEDVDVRLNYIKKGSCLSL